MTQAGQAGANGPREPERNAPDVGAGGLDDPRGVLAKSAEIQPNGEDADTEDGIYPMRVVTRLTGLSADTVRVWERRYGAVRPERTDGNARRYSDADVRRLTLLKAATDQGHAIGELTNLADEQLVAMAKGTPLRNQMLGVSTRGFDLLIDEYLEAISRFDVRRASDLLARIAAITSPRQLVFEFVVPALRETGARWEDGRFSIIEEHIVSGQFKGLLGTMVRLFPVVPNAPRILVGAPEGHLHEFGALVGAMLAATRGIEPVYLGPDVPNKELAMAVRRSKASVIVMSVVRDMEAAEVSDLLAALAPVSGQVELWVGCPDGHRLSHRGVAAQVYLDFQTYDAQLARHYFNSTSPS